MFKKLSVETLERGGNPVRNIDDGSHQIGSMKKTKRLEEIFEENQAGKVLVRESNLESKITKTHEGGGGGNVKNVIKKFGNMANGTYNKHF